jgi:hypothetical protein
MRPLLFYSISSWKLYIMMIRFYVCTHTQLTNDTICQVCTHTQLTNDTILCVHTHTLDKWYDLSSVHTHTIDKWYDFMCTHTHTWQMIQFYVCTHTHTHTWQMIRFVKCAHTHTHLTNQDRIPAAVRFSAPVHTGTGAHTTSLQSLPRPGRSVRHHHHLALRLKKKESYTSIPLLGTHSLFWSELNFYLFRSRWLCRLTPRSAVAPFYNFGLESRWGHRRLSLLFVLCCVSRGLCCGLITHSEES